MKKLIATGLVLALIAAFGVNVLRSVTQGNGISKYDPHNPNPNPSGTPQA